MATGVGSILPPIPSFLLDPNFIAGGGFFVRFSALPARMAWDAFGEKNGVSDYVALKQRVEQYRAEQIRGDPEIGCNVLNSPFFSRSATGSPFPRIGREISYAARHTTPRSLQD